MNILTGRTRTMVLLGLVVLAGCSDVQKRQAGKNLRNATEQARRLYRQSLKILSNPSPEDAGSVDAVDPKALEYLDQAQNLLTTALAKNYDSIKGNPSDTPTADAGMAKMMLGLIDRLRARYFIWSFDLTVLRAEAAMGNLQRQLDKAQICSALLNISETYATLSDEAIQKVIGETEKTKAEVDKNIETLRNQIQAKEKQIAAKKKNIEEKSSKAVALRTEKTLARGAESQKKLEEALKIETGINQIRGEMQRIESELIPLHASLASAEILQSEAKTKITALKEIQVQRQRGTQEIAKTLDQRKAELTQACKSVIATLAELDGLSSRATELAQKAQASLLRASNTMEGAITLLDADKRPASLSEWAHVKVSQGALQRAMLSFRASLKESLDRLTHTWDELHKAKPGQPDSAGATAFLEASQRAQESAQASYSKAVELWERAVRAAPRQDNWQYKRELVVGLLDYAVVLDLTGHNAEATELRKKARDVFSEIETAADRAGKPRSIVSLKKYLLEETGS
jgi:hypothetical protein